jgi:hypothetical protein
VAALRAPAPTSTTAVREMRSRVLPGLSSLPAFTEKNRCDAPERPPSNEFRKMVMVAASA